MSHGAWIFFVFAAGALAGWGAGAWIYRRRENIRARFLSFVAHEINTPITALNMTVLNFVQGTFGPHTKEHEPWMAMIQGDVNRLATLVGDLRDLIHLDFHHDLCLNPESVQLDELVADRVESIRAAMKRSSIELDVEIEKDLPPVEGDPDRLKRIISSLLEHARKFRLKGPVKLACGRGAGNMISVAIEFEGTTMPAEEAAQALDLYYPVHNPKVQVLAGVGIGLGLPNALIAKHGGDMTFGVDKNGRTRVAFQIPMHEGGS